MFWVYILENSIDCGWYIGQTKDLKRRIREHIGGYGCQTTKQRVGWKLIYCEGYRNSTDSIRREKFLKSGAGRIYIKKQLQYYLSSK